MYNRYDSSLYMNMPRYLYSINENRTRENMRQYRAWEDRVNDLFYAENPDYRKMSLRERVAALDEIKKRIGYPY